MRQHRTLVSALCGSLLLASATGAAVSQETALELPPPGAQEAAHNLTLAVTQTDGSVDVIIADEPRGDTLSVFLDMMILTTADQVRFSSTMDTPKRRETLLEIETYIEKNSLPWQVCHEWWMSPDLDYLGTTVKSDFNGSVVLIDNGETSDVIDNPSADVSAAIVADPAFSGVFSGSPERIDDPSAYFNAVNAVWTQIVPVHDLDSERQSKGGWIDGC